MNTCLLDLYIPSKEKLVGFREINTHQQKLISKAAMISDDIYCTEFLVELINTIKPYIEIKDLNIHDLFVILLGLKAASIDLKVPLNIICDKCKKTHKYEVRLDKLYSELCKMHPGTTTVDIDNYTFKIIVPNVLKEIDILYELKTLAFTDDQRAIERSFILNLDRYIGQISNGNEIIVLPTLDKKIEFYRSLSKDAIIQLLTNVQKKQITYKIFDFVCIEPCNKQLYRVLNYDIDKFYFVLKLIFNESIVDILKDEFYLQKIGVPLEYSENITPQERRLMWGFFNELEQKKNTISKKVTQQDPHGL